MQVRRLAPAFLLLAIGAYAQQNSGSIRGTVQDPSGHVISGATVIARHVATEANSSTLTNETGGYVFPTLPIGIYTMTASSTGFKTVERTEVRVVSGEALRLDFDLQLGELTQKVQVLAEVVQVDTTSSTTGTTRTSEEITNLPIQMQGQYRNVMSFMLNLPGVNIRPSNASNSTGGGMEDIGRGSNLGVGDGGFGQDYSGYQIDGVAANMGVNAPLEDNGQPIPEVIEEFRLLTNYNAENGGNLGTTVELVTKSGSNQFHGSVFEYLRNDKLDARNWFDTTGNASPQKQNEFGFTFGGPIKRNRVFFFGSYDGFRFRRAAGGTVGSVPTALMRQGNFSEWIGSQNGVDSLGRPALAGAIYDPATNRPDPTGGVIRDPFPGNIIPANRISPVSDFFQKVWPLPTRPGAQLNWVGTAGAGGLVADRMTLKTDAYAGRHKLTLGSDVQFRKIQSGGARTLTAITMDYSSDNRDDPQKRGRFSDTWSVRPNLIVSFRGAVNRYEFNASNEGLPSGTLGAESGLKGILSPAAPLTRIQNTVGFGWYWNYFHRIWTNVPVAADTAWIKGRHSFKFGAEMMQQVDTGPNDQFGAGNWSFQSRETGLTTVAGTGVGYASFMLGEVDSVTINTPIANKYYGRQWALYAQDEFRVTSGLTLSYGLRWDVAEPNAEVYDRVGSFDPGIPNAAAGGRLGALTFWGNGPGRNGRHHILNTYYKAFGPRFGIAYSPNSKTVARAYYGITYSPIVGDFLNGETTPSYGWRGTPSLSTQDGGVTSAFNWTNGVPPGLIPTLPTLDPTYLNGSSVNRITPTDNKPARSQMIGLSLGQELPGNTIVKAEYVGKLIHGLVLSLNDNSLDPQYYSYGNLLSSSVLTPPAQAAGIAVPYPGFRGSVSQALRAFPQYNNVNQVNSRTAFLLYHALYLTAQKRFRNGLNFLASYTFSKTLNNSSSGALQDRSLLKQAKGLLPFDRPQILNLSYTYDLPFGTGRTYLASATPVLRFLVSGWQISGTHSYQRGQPVVISSQANITSWANRVLGVDARTSTSCASYNPNDPASRYLNIAAFTTPAPWTFGNTYRQPNVRDCGILNENLAINRTFSIVESTRLEFGAEFFNILNRHQWLGLQGDINNTATFGRYTIAGAPRSIQMHLKLRF